MEPLDDHVSSISTTKKTGLLRRAMFFPATTVNNRNFKYANSPPLLTRRLRLHPLAHQKV
jgi:hypothetical protein